MSNPVCSASRSEMLTGRYSFRTGVGGIIGGIGGSNQIDTAEISIPKLLNKYNPSIAKANIGKWHLNNPMPITNLQAPLKLGYNHFEGSFIGQLTSYTNWTKYTNGVSSIITTYATTETVNNAISWIKSNNPINPFFLWLAFNAPHEPLSLPPAGLHTYSTLSGTQPDINAHPKEYFKAMIQAMDHEIGRLRDSLIVINKLDSTDFIFIGDNGNTPRTAQLADTSRAKGTIYQYGVHVPMIISGPSVVNPNRVSDALINTTDIFATVLDLFGNNNWQAQIPVNKPVDSKSIMPIINNNSSIIRPWSFCENFKLIPDSSDGKAMRNVDYKLLRFDYGKDEFYNISIDTLELNNLLTTTLTSTELTNYNYLCNEMTTLVGMGSFCNAGVGIETNSHSSRDFVAFPNPFTSYIQIKSPSKNQSFQLTNALGQVIYFGNQLEKQNFSLLKKGLYYLSEISNSNYHLKLIKE